jgi:hypothetical protein
MLEKLALNSLATAMLEIPAINMPIARSLNLRHLLHCVVTKRHILEWPFIAPSTRCTFVMIMLFNQLLHMPHLSGGWIILAKEKCSLTDVNKFAQHLRKISFLCIWNFSVIFYFNS